MGLLALLTGQSERAPGRAEVAEPSEPLVPFIIPSVPPPGSEEVPHVVLVRLPGTLVCACPVPNRSAEDVRTALARCLALRLDQINGYVLLMRDLHHPGDVDLWDEHVPLPHAFFEPSRGGRRWGAKVIRRPTLQLHRLWTKAPGGTSVAAASASNSALPELSGSEPALLLLESDSALKTLRAGGWPLDQVGLIDAVAAALLLSSGPPQPVHSLRFLRRALPTFSPALALRLGHSHEAILRRHAQLAAGLATTPHSAAAVRRLLLHTLRRVSPLINLVSADAPSTAKAEPCELGVFYTMTDGRVGRRWCFVGVDGGGITLVSPPPCTSRAAATQAASTHCAAPSAATDDGCAAISGGGSRRRLAAIRLGWLVLEGVQSDASGLTLRVALPAVEGLRAWLHAALGVGRAVATTHQGGGQLRVRTRQANLLGCLLRAGCDRWQNADSAAATAAATAAIRNASSSVDSCAVPAQPALPGQELGRVVEHV